jgi:regulator of sirC expression with transglutaminase-like and TPR domain
MLYEKAQRKKEAAREYQRYLELWPDAPDRERIKHRLDSLKAL